MVNLSGLTVLKSDGARPLPLGGGGPWVQPSAAAGRVPSAAIDDGHRLASKFRGDGPADEGVVVHPRTM